jgi:hypothetical protein
MLAPVLGSDMGEYNRTDYHDEILDKKARVVC